MGQESEFDPARTSFTVTVKNQEIAYREFAIYVLPEESLAIICTASNAPVDAAFEMSEGGTPVKSAPGQWTWQAPAQNGLNQMAIRAVNSGETIQLNVFVMIPHSQVKGEYLNGYRIGKYPTKPLRGNPRYLPPAGFVEVTKENQDTKISPHFKLRQFLCKQAGGFPKYVLLQEVLLLKLEMILQKVNAAGFRSNTFNALSGYRTPFYNKAIGNVQYSRHVYGDAADIFVDDDEKNMMDDLNKDGKFTVLDAKVLYNLIDELYDKPFYQPFIGGMVLYRKNARRGPFVHVDVRGYKARW